MKLDDVLPIRVQRYWFHLPITFVLSTAYAAIFGFGGALIIGVFFGRFINFSLLKPLAFITIFDWLLWRNVIPRLAHWFWQCDLDHDTLQITTFTGKKISLSRSEIVSFNESPPFSVLTGLDKEIKLNWTVFPVKERLIVSYWLTRWVPKTALPIEYQEKFDQRKTFANDIESFKKDTFQAASSRSTIRTIRILFIIFGLGAVFLGLYVTYTQPGLDTIAAGLLFVILGVYLSASRWLDTTPFTISIDEHNLQLLSNRKQQIWLWNDIEVMQIRFPSGRLSEMKLWANGRIYDLPIAYLDNLDQFIHILNRQAYAREIPFYIWKE
ncbi:MAG: hypothetical protein D6711_09765 [Chloroflexi bacterium]|nr:MAG: hypothetical protein D6711_09765 [Chloroflexota bacterium]